MNQNISAIKMSFILCIIRAFANVPFAIMAYSLIFYATSKLDMSVSYSTSLVGSFVALNALLYFISGYISGKYISSRHLFALGIFLQMVSAFILACEKPALLTMGLAIYIAGNGISTTCINTIITRTFKGSDSERERAFFWSYSGMNLGFFIGLCLAGMFLLSSNFHALFLLSAISSIITLLVFMLYWKWFKENLSANFDKRQANLIAYGIILTCALSLLLMLKTPEYSNNILLYIGGAIYVISFLVMINVCKDYFYNILAFYFFALVTFVFWMIFQIGPMGLMLFIAKSVNLTLWGFHISPPWLQNINTIAIVVGGPIIASCIKLLRSRGFAISDYTLFTLAMIFMGASFLILPIGIKLAETGLVGIGWIILSLLLQSVGEIFLAPIGYSLVGKLIPQKYQNWLMGIWMMIFGLSAVGSAYFSKLMTINFSSITYSNAPFSHWFMVLGNAAVVLAVLIYILSFFLLKRQKTVANKLVAI